MLKKSLMPSLIPLALMAVLAMLASPVVYAQGTPDVPVGSSEGSVKEANIIFNSPTNSDKSNNFWRERPCYY